MLVFTNHLTYLKLGYVVLNYDLFWRYDHVDIEHVRKESSTQEDNELSSSSNESHSECSYE